MTARKASVALDGVESAEGQWRMMYLMSKKVEGEKRMRTAAISRTDLGQWKAMEDGSISRKTRKRSGAIQPQGGDARKGGKLTQDKQSSRQEKDRSWKVVRNEKVVDKEELVW